MRLKDKQMGDSERYGVLVVDDDPGVIDALKVIINDEKFDVEGFTNPTEALTRMHEKKFHIMILDFLLENITGKQVVEEVRKFDKELFIILLTGYKDMAPPIETLHQFDIQGYCEKSDRFDQLLILLESAVKSIILTRKLLKFQEGMSAILANAPKMYELRKINEVVDDIFNQLLNITNSENGFVVATIDGDIRDEDKVSILQGAGKYNVDRMKLLSAIKDQFLPTIQELYRKQDVIAEKDKIFIPLVNNFNEESIFLCIECEVTDEIRDIIKVFIANAQSSYNNAILHSIVSKKNSDLTSMLNQLQENMVKQKTLEDELRQTQKMEVLGRLTGGIAHDFNNILTVITGYSELLLRRMEKQDATFSKISEIKKAGIRASNLIKQLLAFSRKQNLVKKPLYLNEIIESFKRMVEVLLGAHIDFEYDLSDQTWKSMLDKSQIEQVIMNLVVNAKDAMHDNGTIRIGVKNIPREQIPQLNKQEMEIKDYVKLSVSDNGTGIHPDILPNIFDPFFTTKEKGKGTGLGLSTVYGIIKQMDGYIYVDSIPDKGTTFTIYLPRTEETAVEEANHNGKASLQGNETILVVDDESEIQTYVKAILDQEGYSVFGTVDAHEAISIYNNQNVDLVLTDLIMPVMNGRRLIQEMQKKNPGLKFLFMSGYINNELVEQGFYYSEENFIEKPFTSKSLLSKIRGVLDHKN